MCTNTIQQLGGDLPSATVIIPVFNDPLGLTETLNSVIQQDYPINLWEIIVVDNNSTDDIYSVVRLHLSETISIKYIVEKGKQSSYAARNRGIEQARGEILAFIDADMTIQTNWLRRGVTRIFSGLGDYIGCPVKLYPLNPKPNVWEIYNLRTGFPIQEYMEKVGYAGAGNIFVKREVFNKVGMFDERLISGGDQEFGNRVRDAGFVLYYDEENVMKHPARSSWRSIWKKYFRIGNGTVDLHTYHPDRYGKINWLSVAYSFRPAVKVFIGSRFCGLSPGQKVCMIFLANIARLAYASGFYTGYTKTKKILQL